MNWSSSWKEDFKIAAKLKRSKRCLVLLRFQKKSLKQSPKNQKSLTLSKENTLKKQKIPQNSSVKKKKSQLKEEQSALLKNLLVAKSKQNLSLQNFSPNQMYQKFYPLIVTLLSLGGLSSINLDNSQNNPKPENLRQIAYIAKDLGLLEGQPPIATELPLPLDLHKEKTKLKRQTLTKILTEKTRHQSFQDKIANKMYLHAHKNKKQFLKL